MRTAIPVRATSYRQDRLLRSCEDGIERSCFLRLPPRYDGKTRLPLVVLLHGQGGDPQGVERYTGFGQLADREGFVLACPAATGEARAWSVGLNAGLKDPRDVRYLSHLIERLEKHFAIDPNRVFVAGHSSGAMMAARLAAERSDLVEAIAMVAGTVGAWNIYGKLVELPAPVHPVSVILFHGTDDPVNPYSAHSVALNRNFLPAGQTFAFWARGDGCLMAQSRTLLPGGAVVIDQVCGGKQHSAVELVSIVGGDHGWPGDFLDAPFLNPEDQLVPATEWIWSFFKAHGRRNTENHGG